MIPGRKALGFVAVPILLLAGRLVVNSSNDALPRTDPSRERPLATPTTVELTAFPAPTYSVAAQDIVPPPLPPPPPTPPQYPSIAHPEHPRQRRHRTNDDPSLPRPVPAVLGGRARAGDPMAPLQPPASPDLLAGARAIASLSPPKWGGLIVVTAADAGHFLTLVGAVWALRRTESPLTRIEVYDLGLKSCQRAYLERLLACFVLGRTRVRTFDYSKYPAFFNISDKAGSYAWKPAIVNEVMSSAPPGSSIVWIDAGTEMGRRVGALLADSWSYHEDGFISTVTSGTLKQWTHRGMIDWFEQRFEANVVVEAMSRERFNNPCNGTCRLRLPSPLAS